MYAVYNEGSALQAEDSALGSESEAALQEPDDIKGQALEILAGLTSLGISQDLRDKVQSAIQALDEASASATAGAAGSPGSAGPGAAGATGRWGPGAGGRSGKGAGPGGAAALEAAERQVDALEKKLAMSRNIMRKLYHKVRAAGVRGEGEGLCPLVRMHAVKALGVWSRARVSQTLVRMLTRGSWKVRLQGGHEDGMGTHAIGVVMLSAG